MHIPKCGGTSFSNVLKSWFGTGFLQNYHDEKQNKPPKKYDLYADFSKERFISDLCIHGHFNNQRKNSVQDYYPEVDQLISIIRNPFDVHLSSYFYVKREAQCQGGGAYRAGKPHRIIANQWSLIDYLRDVKKSYICNFLPAEITLDNYKEIIEERFIFIGTTENLQDSVNILAYKLNFPAVTVPIINTSQWTEDIPSSALIEFIANNPLEMAIYHYVKSNIKSHLSQIRK